MTDRRTIAAEAMHKADCACGVTLTDETHTPEAAEWYFAMADAALAALPPDPDRRALGVAVQGLREMEDQYAAAAESTHDEAPPRSRAGLYMLMREDVSRLLDRIGATR